MAEIKGVNPRIKQHAQMLRSHVAFRELVVVLEERLQNARDEYEENPASEFSRGRVNELKDLLILFKA